MSFPPPFFTRLQPAPYPSPIAPRTFRKETNPEGTYAPRKTTATIPVMGPEASSESFEIGTTIQSVNTSAYLNIVAGDTSYKTLAFAAEGEGAQTEGWGLEGDTIITTTGSAWGRQLNFLACQIGGGGGQYWQVYLQTGSETPAGRTCSNYQTLHLPCLC